MPEEDEGYFLVNLQLPDAASLQRSDEVTKKIEQILLDTPGVSTVTAAAGYSLLTGFDCTEYGVPVRRSGQLGGAHQWRTACQFYS